ncbi:Y-family DNA polymerase [Neokomagataea anthophila]|uniref:DNA-directed DNA polymerase n=1 Tax=Neokomagataea anthophila TaxID=2826925 RepID=A0ABS5E9H2_9PROT|nr:Y-family DNA polymerase [Neokomagataea anthophila]MBR0560524.1 Y-family DNA polymerase [Neokomagataea anthophila]
MTKLFALIDGNAFYCSCERAFDPRLHNKPVVVLSGNDGCAIARTNEAKACGVAMGEPWHLARKRPECRDVIWRSSNFALYADMSRRVSQILQERVPAVEHYSIDEFFLDLTGIADVPSVCAALREDVWRLARIPTCVGWGPTKTLAKLANHIAKKHPEFAGLCDLSDPAQRMTWFARLPVESVWGIGRKQAERLQGEGVHTIADLMALETGKIRKRLSVTGVRLVAELNGVSNLDLQEGAAPRHAMTVSRSFGQSIRDRKVLQAAVASFVSRLGESLRAEGRVAAHMTVFIRTNPFKQGPRYANQAAMTMTPTSDTRDLIRQARRLVHNIWRDGYAYDKAGVILSDIRSSGVQGDLWGDTVSSPLMAAMDQMNARYGRKAVYLLATGIEEPWRGRSALRSPSYTTILHDIPLVRSG